MTNFTSKQKEIVARKLGYDGPMQGFDEFIASSPALQSKYNMVTQKYVERMANGGMVKKYADGGNVTGATVTTDDRGVPIVQGDTKLEAVKIQETPDQIIDTDVAPTTATTATAQSGDAATVSQPDKIDTSTVTASTSTPAVTEAMKGVDAAKGAVSDKAQVEAAQGEVSKEALAEAQKVDEKYIQEVTAKERKTGSDELVTAQTEEFAPTVEAAQAAAPKAIEAAQGVVRQEEIAKAAQIKEEDMAQATAITADGLAPDAVAVAARLEKFTVDDGTLAEAAQGNVEAQATVQGQLTELMKSFDDGKTPAWAAGAIRAANAAMASRGLGGSSMAATAVFQAAMESALPIASQDAQTFAQMGMQNLNNRQQVALANAAAQQGLSLQNLSNEQQAALQNSANAFSLQSQNLSNMQQTMIANAQIKASLQGQNLSNQQQANLAEAARYAEVANMNLNNIQQARLQDSMNTVQVDLANLSNKQQSYVVNAQLQASLQNQNLSNKQQAAVLNAARIAENANMTFTAEQQAQIHNSTLMQTIGTAELSAAQSATLANAATYAAMDMANLDNRQKALVQNAQAFLAMDLKNLDNEQQTSLFKAQQITQSILSDTAAENAAKQFNASSENQTNQFMATLASNTNQFNATQTNAMTQFNTDQANSLNKFNAEQQNVRDQFNANQRLVIDQSNAQWRRDISTANTAAENAANYLNAQNSQQLTMAEYNNQTQLYRDQVEMAWSSYEKNEDRATQIIVQQISSAGSLKAAEAQADSTMWASITEVATRWAFKS
jgi:hypothetical protein